MKPQDDRGRAVRVADREDHLEQSVVADDVVIRVAVPVRVVRVQLAVADRVRPLVVIDERTDVVILDERAIELEVGVAGDVADARLLAGFVGGDGSVLPALVEEAAWRTAGARSRLATRSSFAARGGLAARRLTVPACRGAALTAASAAG
jgi:hypothetical protein